MRWFQRASQPEEIVRVDVPKQAYWVIVDENDSVVVLSGMQVFERKIELASFFTQESDALEVLYAIEENRLSSAKLRIICISSSLCVPMERNPIR